MKRPQKQINDSKIATAIREASIQCKCSNRVLKSDFVRGRYICKWCGRTLYVDGKTEFEYKLKDKLRRMKNV